MSEPDGGTPRHWHATPHQIALAVGRILVAILALLLVYFMFPLDKDDNVALGLFTVLIGLTVFGLIFYRQLHKIRNAEYPLLRAAESVALVGTLFITLMAGVAIGFADADPSNYSEPLTRIDALYFTVTTLATVGFGDITPTAAETRAFTTFQIILGVGLLGVGLRSLFGVAQQVAQHRQAEAPPTEPRTQPTTQPDEDATTEA